MATIYDIAKEAGVSPATVSKVFNDYPEVSKKTKEKVLKIADSVGYIPNLTARSLKTNKSFLVGVMFSEDLGIGLEHQFFSVILESFRKAIGEYGYDTVFINKKVGAQNMGYLEHCQYRNVDGVFIITALPNDVSINKLLLSHIKCVTTDIVYDNTPMVASNNYQGAKEAIKYLHKKGHKRIGHISGPFHTMSSTERYQGVLDAFEELNLVLEEAYFVETESFTFESAFKATQQLLTDLKKPEYPSAIFVGADIMAIAAIKAIQSRGLRVPEDISVIGFDDIEAARYVTPELTTVRQNKVLIGQIVAKSLFELMTKEEAQYEIPRVPTSIIERQSVKSIRY